MASEREFFSASVGDAEQGMDKDLIFFVQRAQLVIVVSRKKNDCGICTYTKKDKGGAVGKSTVETESNGRP